MQRHSVECYEDLTAGEMTKLLMLAAAVCDAITTWPELYRRLPRVTDTNADIRAKAAQAGLRARGYVVTLAPLSPGAFASSAINQGEACALLGHIGDLATLPEVSNVNAAANAALNALERASIVIASTTSSAASRTPLIIGGLAILAIGAAFLLSRRGRRSGALGDVEGIDSDWWRRYRKPEHKLCYRSKTEALTAFRDANRGTIESWGGLDVTSSPAEFDAINHRHSDRLRGKKAITLAQALWAAMPNGAPYCLDEIDVEALNDTSPGRAGSGFRLPDWAYEKKFARMEADEAKRWAREELEPAPF